MAPHRDRPAYQVPYSKPQILDSSVCPVPVVSSVTGNYFGVVHGLQLSSAIS